MVHLSAELSDDRSPQLDDRSPQLNDFPFGSFARRGLDADDCTLRFRLIDNGAGQPNGSEGTQGCPSDWKGEEMVCDLIDHAGGLKPANEAEWT